MEHPERRQWVDEIGKINRKINTGVAGPARQ